MAHLGSFFVATAINLITFMIQMVIEYSDKVDENTISRLTIASNILSILGVFFWLIANCLVMVIFVKYGKPLETDLE